MAPYSLFSALLLTRALWEPYGPWSKVVHYIGNRVPIGTQPEDPLALEDLDDPSRQHSGSRPYGSSSRQWVFTTQQYFSEHKNTSADRKGSFPFMKTRPWHTIENVLIINCEWKAHSMTHWTFRQPLTSMKALCV